MSRLNSDPLMILPDGSHLVISTQQSVGGEFLLRVVQRHDGTR